ncbi:hypothetical protein M6D81_30020 [Paenibacillus sp. J5C_2022]|nr:hypothetical protein [Paenibacillus sp. J5C2022]
MALIEDSEGKKKLKMGHFNELQAMQPYVLFLKKSPDSDIYYIVRNSDGQEKIAQGSNLEEQVQAILQKHKVNQ